VALGKTPEEQQFFVTSSLVEYPWAEKKVALGKTSEEQQLFSITSRFGFFGTHKAAKFFCLYLL
jgi:hypothetical protein